MLVASQYRQGRSEFTLFRLFRGLGLQVERHTLGLVLNESLQGFNQDLEVRRGIVPRELQRTEGLFCLAMLVQQGKHLGVHIVGPQPYMTGLHDQ